jgi:hypothetical protein
VVQSVPAAAGGIPGAAGTYWLTGGMLVNAGAETAQVVVELAPDDQPLGLRSAGPLTIPPRTALSFDNLVSELFLTNELGGLWVDSSHPIVVSTRTFNRSTDGTFGQGVGGIQRSDTLGEGEGAVYLVGLHHNQSFRTNLLLQEVDGLAATAVIEIYTHAGQRTGVASIEVGGRSRWQAPITDLGVEYLEAGYGRIRVQGEGRLAVLGSVVDRRTGDAATIDAVHEQRAAIDLSGKTSEIGDAHHLVAVVARAPGANETVWRSEASILNTRSEEQQLELRYVPASGPVVAASVTVGAGAMFSSQDVVGELFVGDEEGTGALHIYSDGGLIVSSRTYNLLPDGATLGQSLPGLADGDMARAGEAWLLDSLSETPDFRCNLGFTEYEGTAADVTVALFDVDNAVFRYLGAKTYTVPALGNLQVNRVFRDLGLTGSFPRALAYLTVSSQGGAVYAYASVVDNGMGDATTVLAKRQ